MSFAVLPDPFALSASLLVIETNLIFGEGSVLSVAVAVILTVTYLWFGGHKLLGAAAVTVRVGGVVSATWVTTAIWVTVTVTFAVPVLPA